MAKILEQNDIDALFSGGDLAEPEPVKEQVKIYDFRHPDRLSKEQNKLLVSIMDNFCRFTATFISATTRSLVEMSVSSIDQLTYNEYMFSMNEPVALYIVRFKELGGRSIFEFAPKFVLFLVDRMLGGNGDLQEDDRDLTGIEERISLNVMEKIFLNFSSIWKDIFPFSSNYESFESNPRLVQIAPPGESVVLLSFNINIDGKNTLFNICVPFITLQQPLRNLISRNWNIELDEEKDYNKEILTQKKNVQRFEVGVTCILGKQKTSVQALNNYKVGDTIRLNQQHEKSLVLRIGGKDKYWCEPGILGERKAVRVMGRIT